jgi:8-oxo-dGTP pyrophosphatase MutT (NUDIX family)
MMIKIFVDEKPIYLSSTLTEEMIVFAKQKNVFFVENEKVDKETILATLAADTFIAAVLLGRNFTALKKDFFSQFNIVEAGGGIVQNEKKELLFIYRRKKWDLPKGKLEKGESIEQCAAREIEEETGVAELLIKSKIGETYHIYTEKNKPVLKISHWFYFTTTYTLPTTAQIEEDIAEVKWIATKDIQQPMLNTYGNIKEIVHKFFNAP